MKHQTVAAWEIFKVEPELAYAVCFQMLAVPPDPEELAEQGAPPEVVQAARVLKQQRFIREENRPRRFVVETIDGPVTSRLEMDFAADFAGTWVTQRFSLHPHGFLARLLTAIPRRRLWQLQGSMREQLRFLKSRCEDRGFLISVHSPPQEEQQRRLRARCELLLAGFAYFEILLGDGKDSAVIRDLPRILYENARFHLVLTGGSWPEDADLRRIVEERIHPAFERRLEAGDGDSLSFFVDAFPYYIAWANRLFATGEDGMMALDGIARGDREVMGRLVLESYGPPEAEERARMWEKMEQMPEHLLHPFAKWLQERRGAPAPSATRKGSPPAVPRVPVTARHHPSPKRIAEAERHYARGRALIEAVHPGDRAQAEHALAAFNEAAALLTRADGYVWGHVQMNRVLALMAQSRPGHRAQDVEEAISACNEALAVFTRHEHPVQHGLAKLERGRLMASRIVGPLRSNLEGAIADFQDAADVLDPADHPLPWAEAQVSLAGVLVKRPGYSRSTNIEEAIAAAQRALTVLDPEAAPLEWAHAKVALGDAFAARSEGDPAENLELSIEHLQAALSVFGPQADPVLRGLVLHDLAASYLDRIAGSPADNVEKAIALLEEAITLGHAGSNPSTASDWMALGIAYMARRRGEPQANFALAMEAYKKAAEGLRRDDDPQLWAILQENIGDAWLSSPDVDSDETLRLAIASFEAALEILTPLDDPRSWVLTQVSLGNAYTRFSRSQPPVPEAFVGNVEKAIAAYDAALTRAHREADPWKWAGLHKNRAIAYEGLRLTAEQVEAAHLVESIDEESRASMGRALEVFTLERAPREHVTGSLLLGMVHLRRKEWQAAEAAFTSVLRASDLLVSGIEVNEAEARDTLQSLGRLAVNIPVPALRLGDAKRAFALWESSRARLLAKALHLETLGLSAAERQELHEAQNEVDRIERRLARGPSDDRSALLDRKTRLQHRMKDIVDPHRPPGGLGPEEVEALVAACTRDGSVIAAPILTEAGSQILLGLKGNGQTEIRIVELELEGEGRRLLGEILGRWIETGRGGIRSREVDDVPSRHWRETLQELGPKLWQLFAGRLVEHLDASGIPRGAGLVLLPHGGLGLLPLGLACDPATGEALSDCYELSYAPSLTALARARERAAEAEARPARAAVIEADRLGTLIASKPEATLVQSWFPAGDPGAPLPVVRTPDQALALLAGKDVWHFATHGKFDRQDPTRSGLELFSESLTVTDLLQAKALGNPRLAVLSACSSGIYDTHDAPLEFTGLPAGFLQAGAAGVIATLWPVYDVPTMLCIGRFYDLFMGEGLHPGAALQQAQQWLRRASLPVIRERLLSWIAEGRISEAQSEALSKRVEPLSEGEADPVFSHPEHWSAFVHYGA